MPRPVFEHARASAVAPLLADLLALETYSAENHLKCRKSLNFKIITLKIQKITLDSENYLR